MASGRTAVAGACLPPAGPMQTWGAQCREAGCTYAGIGLTETAARDAYTDHWHFAHASSRPLVRGEVPCH